MRAAMSAPATQWPSFAPCLAAASASWLACCQSPPATPRLTAAATAEAEAMAIEVLCVARQVSATLATRAASGCGGIMTPTGAMRMAAPLVSPYRPASSGAMPLLMASSARLVEGPSRS